MKTKWVFLSLLCVAAISSSAFGTIATTSQTWTFSNNANPATADQPDGNIYGDATATVTVTAGNITPVAEWRPYYQGRYGVWIGDTATVDLTIPNSPVPNPYKEIWVEVGCRGHFPPQIPDTETPPAQGFSLGTGYWVVSPQGGLVDDLGFTFTDAGGGWRTLLFGVRVYPNPASETIRFTLLNSGADIDYITVNTACVPEPATMLLLSLGGIVSFISRKK